MSLQGPIAESFLETLSCVGTPPLYISGESAHYESVLAMQKEIAARDYKPDSIQHTPLIDASQSLGDIVRQRGNQVAAHVDSVLLGVVMQNQSDRAFMGALSSLLESIGSPNRVEGSQHIWELNRVPNSPTGGLIERRPQLQLLIAELIGQNLTLTLRTPGEMQKPQEDLTFSLTENSPGMFFPSFTTSVAN